MSIQLVTLDSHIAVRLVDDGSDREKTQQFYVYDGL